MKKKSWKNITIKQFIDIDSFTDASKDEFDYKVQLISYLTGKTEDQVLALSIDEFKRLGNSLSFLSNTEISTKVPYNIKVNGIRFLANLNIHEISGAELIDLTAFCKDNDTAKKNIHKTLAIFYKPKDKWFGLKKVSMRRGEVAELFYEHLTIDKAYPISVFFYTLWNNLLKNIQTSLDQSLSQMRTELLKMLEKEKKASSKNGDGI